MDRWCITWLSIYLPTYLSVWGIIFSFSSSFLHSDVARDFCEMGYFRYQKGEGGGNLSIFFFFFFLSYFSIQMYAYVRTDSL